MVERFAGLDAMEARVNYPPLLSFKWYKYCLLIDEYYK